MSTPALPTMHGVKDHVTESILLLILCCSLVQTVEIWFQTTTDETITEGGTVTRNVCHDSSVPTSNAIFFSLSASPVTSVLTLPRDLSIPAGSSTCVTVTIGSVDNFVREDTRTFQISLSSTFADVVENQGQFFVNVWDNGFISGVSCPTPTVINSSPTSCSTFTTGSVCSYGCDDGFERLFGDASRTCTDLFRWSGSPLFCIPVNAAPNPPNCPDNTLYVTATQGRLTPVQYGPFTCEDSDERNPLTATCVPASGSAFNMGQLTVICTCTDPFGEESHCTFDVIVAVNQAPGPPNCPENSLYIPTSQGITPTAAHYGPFTCMDGNTLITATCTPESGSLFSNGRHQVTCTCIDIFNERSQCNFELVVEDNTAPSNPSCPPVMVPATQGSTTPEAIYGPFSCFDAEEMWIPATCNPPSGTQLSIGQHGVTCSCTDQFGEVGQCIFTVTVRDVDECSTSSGHSCDTSKSDCKNTQGDYYCQCKPGFIGADYTPPSPATCQRDTTPPEVLSCPSNKFQTVQFGTPGTIVTWNEPSARDDSMSVSVSSRSHMSGSYFNVGTTAVTYVFIDPAGNTAECIFDVSVVQDCTVLYSNTQCNPGTCTCMFESCDLGTGVCRSSCTVMNCPADIESVSLSKVNPNSSVAISCTLKGSAAVLQRLQLRLSSKSDDIVDNEITRLAGNGNNDDEVSIFEVDSVTKANTLYCVLAQGNIVIGGVNVTNFVHELPILSAAPIHEGVSNTSITMSWSAWDPAMDVGDPPIVAYIPYYRMDASDQWISGPRILRNETLQFKADNLEVDTLYDLRVTVVREGENGEGPRSPSVKVKTLCNVPDVVTSVNVQLTSSNKVNVSWQLPPGEVMCSTGVTHYKVYYRIEGNIDDTPQLAGTVEDVDTRWFIVDDGLLQPESSYIFFVTVTTDQESGFRMSQAIEAPADTSVPVYLISLIIIPILLIAVIVVFIIIRRKSSSKDKKATKANDGEDTDYVNAVMADDPEDYIPLKEQSKTLPSSKYEDLNQKQQGGVSIPPQYEVTIVPQPQKPVATPRYHTRNMKGVNSGAFEDVRAGSENRQLPDVPQSHPSGDEDEDSSYEVPDRLEKYTGVYINIKNERKLVQPGPIKVAEFQTFMNRNKEDVVNDIVQQFMALPSGGQYPWSVALKLQNKPRNFFKTILAYDHSRVKLDTNGSDAWSDYINASYIKNHQGKTSFIAAQGPQEGTVDDFWKMVWQENVETIVMVTDNIEKNKLLCDTYWPKKVHTSKVFDNITVLLIESTTYTTHEIRKLNLLKGKHKTEVHTVTQIHVHSWPYGSVPKEPASLISIIKKVKSLQTDGSSSPLLVHCSNGVGATGTFIAVYVLMDTINKNKDANIFDFVKNMRDDRVDMVQTRIQYLFIFECLLAVLQSTDSQISCDQLKKLGHAAIKLKSKKEYKVFQESVIEEQHCEDYIGNSPENQHKNRFKNLMPVDKFRPVLKSEGGLFGSNSYINAIHLTDFSGREFIMTQTPLSSTVEDFWRLVYDYECTTIVMLNTVDGSDETVVQYWPSGGGAQYGLMTVECKSTTKGDSCTQSQFQVAHKKGEKWVSVEHFAFCGWSGNQPDVSKLRQFIRYTGNKNGPVLVHCINGVGLSAVYVIVKTESENLEQEGSADVFQCLTKLRKICPNAIQSQEEYTLCYKLLKDHLDNPEEYAVVY